MALTPARLTGTLRRRVGHLALVRGRFVVTLLAIAAFSSFFWTITVIAATWAGYWVHEMAAYFVLALAFGLTLQVTLLGLALTLDALNYLVTRRLYVYPLLRSPSDAMQLETAHRARARFRHRFDILMSVLALGSPIAAWTAALSYLLSLVPTDRHASSIRLDDGSVITYRHFDVFGTPLPRHGSSGRKAAV